MAKMTARQKRFCEEFLIDMNATKAAIRAGYSEKTANVIASQNLAKLNIREYIEKRMEEKNKELIADQDEVMRYLTSVMRREKCENVVVTVSEEVSEYVLGEDGKTRKETRKTERPEVVEIPARLQDANKAAELLGKAYGIYTDRVEAEIDTELHITINYGSDDG